MAEWTGTTTAAYILWAGLPFAALLASLAWTVRTRRARGAVPWGEILLAAGFNAAVPALLAVLIIPEMIPDLPRRTCLLVSLPFFAYGLLGYSFLRLRLKGKRGASRRALGIYAFSFAGYLAGLMPLFLYLLAPRIAGLLRRISS